MVKKRKSAVVSSDSAEVQKFKELAKRVPDVRQEKIDEIKKKIESGEYKVDSEAVASKMLELAQDMKKITPRSKDQ